MTGVLLRFEVFGDVQISRRLERFSSHLANPEPAWEEIISAMRDSIREQFLSEGQHGSGGWEPLSPSRIAQKDRLNLRPEILRATDDMFRSLTEEGAENQVHEVDAEGFTFGTDLPYPPLHQTGTQSMPQRKPVEFPEHEREEFVRILQRHIMSRA